MSECVEIGGVVYEVESITEPCGLGTSYHYHEEEHDGVPPMVSHHHHGPGCQRVRAILVPVEPVTLPEVVIPEREQHKLREQEQTCTK